MKRFYCLPGLSKSSLNWRLRRLSAEQDGRDALSDIATDDLPVAASPDRGITVVNASVLDCQLRLTIDDAGNDEGVPTVEIEGSPSTSGGQPDDQIAGPMPRFRVRYSSGDNFTGVISDDILATYTHCNMPLTDLGRWLRMLNSYFPHLPIDPRTILRTPRSNELRCIGGGEYVHLGLIASLLRACCQSRTLQNTVHIQIHVDGMTIFRGSLRQCALIPGRVIRPWLGEAFVIGIFYGNSKPISVAEYLEDLIAELDALLRSGLRIPGRDFVVCMTLQAVICDSPACAYLKQIKGHAGYHGCDKCVTRGVHAGGRVIFSNLTCRLRNDGEFRRRRNRHHHHPVPSPFESLPVDMISDFPCDRMHPVYLFVTRRLLFMWKNDIRYRMPMRLQNQLSDDLRASRVHVPVDFARKFRSFDFVQRWKATELRLFLLCLGPVLLKSVLSNFRYINYSRLFISTYIFSTSYFSSYQSFATTLLRKFVDQYILLYSANSAVFNIHSLIHLPADVVKHGTLDVFSAFPSESLIGKLQRIVRGPNRPHIQVFRRLSELVNCNLQSMSADDCDDVGCFRYRLAASKKQLSANHTVFIVSSPDCFAVVDGKPSRIVDFDDSVFKCRVFVDACDF